MKFSIHIFALYYIVGIPNFFTLIEHAYVQVDFWNIYRLLLWRKKSAKILKNLFGTRGSFVRRVFGQLDSGVDLDLVSCFV